MTKTLDELYQSGELVNGVVCNIANLTIDYYFVGKDSDGTFLFTHGRSYNNMAGDFNKFTIKKPVRECWVNVYKRPDNSLVVVCDGQTCPGYWIFIKRQKITDEAGNDR